MEVQSAFRIYGKVVGKETGQGLSGLTVKAVDKDLLFDDLLGSTITDRDGYFEIRYDEEDFQELFFDARPDIFLKIKNADGRVIHTTVDKVRFEANKVERFIVEISRISLTSESRIEVVVKRDQGGEVLHPDGLRIQAPAEAFASDAAIKLIKLGKPIEAGNILAALGNSFWIHSTVASRKDIHFSVDIEAEEIQHLVLDACRFFFEIREERLIRVVSGRLKVQRHNGKSAYAIETHFGLPEHTGVSIAAGVFTPVTPSNVTFHPTPHQFKISGLDLHEDGTTCRRAGTWKVDEECWGPKPYHRPQTLYPACYPAAWARLYGAYRLVLGQQRQWEMGTPQCPDPPPDETGDYFSTWSMRTDVIGQVPLAMRVEDWHTGTLVRVDPPVSFEFGFEDPDTVNEDAIRERAENIKDTLVALVGRHGSSAGKPVYIDHSGHAWNIVGVEEGGFWSHGQNPETQSLSDWCTWEHADWLQGELELLAAGTTPHDKFTIRFPQNCRLKPREARLGSIAMWGSGGKANNIQFIELSSGTSIDWTPHMLARSAGYVWIEDGVALDYEGFPADRTAESWEDDFGFRVPLPMNDSRQCRCDSPDGCPNCRTRLQLPFWVHNTTKDERLKYRVDLYFWASDGRWVSVDAKVMQLFDSAGDLDCSVELPERVFPTFPIEYPCDYDLPASIPRPREVFEISATPDVSEGRAGRGHPWNCQPIAWYVDFRRDQLINCDSVMLPALHGIKLVLTCIDSCTVQDVKQLWFKSQPEGPI